MTSKEKALIESAKPYQDGIDFHSIYIINSKKLYNGFWGKNDYRQIIVIGETENKERYRIEGNQHDVLEINNLNANTLRFEIHKDNDCLHMWVDSPNKIVCHDNQLSTLSLEVKHDT